MAYQLPALPYAYDALEPHFDTQTMEIHHSKHHQAYVNNANAVLANLPEWEKLSAEELIARLAELPENVRTPLRNNAGGHANHSLFWQILKTSTPCKASSKPPSSAISAAWKPSRPSLKKPLLPVSVQVGLGWCMKTASSKLFLPPTKTLR